MNNSIALAVITLLLGVVPLPSRAREEQPAPTLADLESALNLDRRGEFQEAIQKYQVFLSSPTINLDSVLHAYVLKQMADAENGLGDYAKGEMKAREALRLLAGANQSRTSTLATTEGVLADSLDGEGNYFKARKVAQQAVTLGKETISPRAPSVGVLLNTLALTLQTLGQHRQALKLLQEAAGIMEKAGEDNRIELGTAYTNLAGAYLAEGDTKKTLALAALALATWNQVLPPNNSHTVYALSMEILGYKKLRAYRAAEVLIPPTVELAQSQLGPNHPDRVMLLEIAASVYIAERKYELAEPLLKQGVDVSRRLFSLGNPVFRTALANYSYVLTKLGQTEEASRIQAESGALLAFPER